MSLFKLYSHEICFPMHVLTDLCRGIHPQPAVRSRLMECTCCHHQVVHHLFPGICHVHYPKIAPIVLQTCKEFNVPYVVYPTVSSSLQSTYIPCGAALPYTHAYIINIWSSAAFSCLLTLTISLFGQFLTALEAHFKHLGNVGSGHIVPSLATVG